jgi:hypothetical protein
MEQKRNDNSESDASERGIQGPQSFGRGAMEMVKATQGIRAQREGGASIAFGLKCKATSEGSGTRRSSQWKEAVNSIAKWTCHVY